ncbi:phage holin family protein [Quadrisphaera sp. INWT6]|uniref:phage holin family protein n=1 Tax=Quadrisphaera sp. INWT6 TaxID=2596917 RepID=UPI001892255B|nr:phage holin family protein [Quadrisphaera sp. INWT6]MBF5081235.1 phage holin family protein [Quadrisphaera sp. INWT6]
MSHAVGDDARAGAPPTATGEPSNLGDLFSRVTSDLSTLVRQEIALAKAEATQSATRAGKGAGLLAGAGVSGHFVLLFLSVALWWGLGNVIGRGWSALVVAVVWAVIAAVLASVGRKELKTVQGLPATTSTLQQVPSALKGREEENHR